VNPLRCYYHPDYEYPLPDNHPFPMHKFRLAAGLLQHLNLSPQLQVLAPEIIDDALVEQVHHPRYLQQLQTAKLPPTAEKRIGLPVRRQELYQRSRLEVSGTVAAMRAAFEDGIAFNLAGGTHHAYPDAGSGYCVLNDVAIAIRAIQQEKPGIQCMVIDTDAHQGNGTHYIFANDSNVFTYSIHVGKNFPSRKEPGTLDVPLPRWVTGDEYLAQLQRTLPTAIEIFEPDLIFWITGVDPHLCDRFGQMDLTCSDMDQRNQRIMQWLLPSSAPVTVLFGGGYHAFPDDTATLHTRAVLMAAAAFARHHHQESLSRHCFTALEQKRMQVSEPHVQRIGRNLPKKHQGSGNLTADN
jgi:acetoin utilization deacetylase AcuC-like enzyme